MNGRLHVRLIGTTLAAAAFLTLCWLAAGDVSGDTRILAGPLGFFQSQSLGDKLVGTVPTCVLLPCIFAAGLRCNVGTLILSAFGLLVWLGVGVWIEGCASC